MSKLMKARFTEAAEKAPKKEYPGRHSTTLSEDGEAGYLECEKRFPVLNQSELLELAVLVLKDAAPASIRKIYQGRDTLVEEREKTAGKEAKKNQKVKAEAGIPGDLATVNS